MENKIVVTQPVLPLHPDGTRCIQKEPFQSTLCNKVQSTKVVRTRGCVLPDEIKDLPRSADVFRRMDQDPVLSYSGEGSWTCLLYISIPNESVATYRTQVWNHSQLTQPTVWLQVLIGSIPWAHPIDPHMVPYFHVWLSNEASRASSAARGGFVWGRLLGSQWGTERAPRFWSLGPSDRNH